MNKTRSSCWLSGESAGCWWVKNQSIGWVGGDSVNNFGQMLLCCARAGLSLQALCVFIYWCYTLELFATAKIKIEGLR